MKVLDYKYDAASNKTHAKIDTGMFREWYWIAGCVERQNVLDWLEPPIWQRLADFAMGIADTPHEIEGLNWGLL